MKKILSITMLLIIIQALFPAVSYASDDCVNRPIKQLATNQETHGSIFYLLGIGAGSSNQNFYYYIFVKTAGRGYKMIKENIEDVTIIEGAKNPHMWSCNGWQDGVGWRNNSFDDDISDGYSEKMNVYIPAGSIVPTFTINMNK